MSISTNNENLQAILNTVNSLPDAGSGGGGSTPETCDATIVYTGYGAPTNAYYLYTKYENGSIESAYIQYTDDQQNNVILHNAVVGSIFCVMPYGRWGGRIPDSSMGVDCELAADENEIISVGRYLYPFRITGNNPVLTLPNDY